MPATNLSELLAPRQTLPTTPGTRFFAGLAGLSNPLQGRIRWCEVRSASRERINAVDLGTSLPITFELDGSSPDSGARFLIEDAGPRREPEDVEEAIAAFRARAQSAVDLMDVTDDILIVTRNCIDFMEPLSRDLQVVITPERQAVVDKARKRLDIVSAPALLEAMAKTALQELRNTEAHIIAAGGLFSSPDNEQEPSKLYKGLRFARDYLDVFIVDKNSVRGSMADKLVHRQLAPALTMLTWGKDGLSEYLPFERFTQPELAAAFAPEAVSATEAMTFQRWDAESRAHGYTDDAGWLVNRMNLDASDLLRLEVDPTPDDLTTQAPIASRGMRP